MSAEQRRGEDAFRYTFRFCSDPDFKPERDKADLMRFVQEACIDDVAMFIAPQDLCTGHMAPQELEVYAAYFEQIQRELAKYGATLSINQWYSIMHADLGYAFLPGQNFAPMVDIRGNASASCACPADEAWQTYLCQSFARMAQLQPEILWVEDDFRYHNHEPLEWGGCFCEKHMRMYADRVGRDVSRDDFIAGVLKPGAVHPYRRVWLDVCHEVQCYVAQKLGLAVREVSQTTKVGLMSSAPYMHAAEGRRWCELLRAFAAGAPPVNRVHLPGYVEVSPSEYLKNFNMVAMQTRHFLPAETEVYPELENYPYSLYTKSLAFTRFQMLASLPLAESGLAMNMFDLNGNGIVFEEGFQQMLREVKPYLNELTQCGAFRLAPQGVRVMCAEDASYSLHTVAGENMLELCPQEVFFAGLLPAMGIPFAYCSDADVAGEILAISGQYLRGLGEKRLRALFANNFVVLSGDALETLCELGMGSLAGVKSVRWMRQNEGEYSYEQATELAGEGFVDARASAIIYCCDALNVTYEDADIEVYSRFYSARREAVCPGHAVVGDRVLVYPFGQFEGPTHMPPMLLNRVRAAILQSVLGKAAEAGGKMLPVVLDAPHIAPYYYQDSERRYLYLLNATSDAASEICVQLCGVGQEGQSKVLALSGSASMGGEYGAVLQGECVRVDRALPAMQAVLFSWKREG